MEVSYGRAGATALRAIFPGQSVTTALTPRSVTLSNWSEVLTPYAATVNRWIWASTTMGLRSCVRLQMNALAPIREHKVEGFFRMSRTGR